MSDRRLNPISTDELHRRWTAARTMMSERGIDALVMQNNNDWLGGYVKWFTDYPAYNGYPRTVIFHAGDAMTVVDMGPSGGIRSFGGQHGIHRGVGDLLTTPAFTSIAYTDGYQGELALGELKRRGYKRIGLLGQGAMPYRFVTQIEQGLAGKTEIVDATEEIDAIKAIKSEEEMVLVRRCAQMQDEIFARVCRKIKPGMRDNDVTALAQYEGRMLGSEQGLFLGSSAPLGEASNFVDRYMQGRVLKEGEHFSLLIENAGPGGMYTEIARTMVFGKASNEVMDGFETVKEAQIHTLSKIRPGVPARDIAAAHDAFMAARGFDAEKRLYAHGQGYDLVERPLIRADETMTIQAGMNLAVHPGYESPSLFAVICDNYLVGPDGPGECLHETPKQVFEL
ncbi:MAG: M24 family metallopeptidase [Pseudorhodoplanes sp.]|uniref:M24 family metallopeptidase n=1 Tax=Pseudorhodoplanes sp. TaxID=1934341 RepID=UPI003D0D2AAC